MMMERHFAAVAYVGQHSKANIRGGIMAHGYSWLGIQNMLMNGKPVGEISVIAAMAGHFGTPVIMLSGDQAAANEIHKILPGAEVAVVNPKNLLLAAGAGSALALIGPSTSEAVVSLIVFVVIASLTIAGPVAFYLLGGDRAKAQLDSAKGWLAVHNSAVMAVLFLVFGVNLISKGIPPLTATSSTR